MLSERYPATRGKNNNLFNNRFALNLVGCYYHQMNPEEYNFNEKGDIQVTTKDTTYSLSAKDYIMIITFFMPHH